MSFARGLVCSDMIRILFNRKIRILTLLPREMQTKDGHVFDLQVMFADLIRASAPFFLSVAIGKEGVGKHQAERILEVALSGTMLQPKARYSNDQITDMILALSAAH